jgi:hypothetical protein
MRHKPTLKHLGKLVVVLVALATGVLGAATLASADQGGVPHSAKPCPPHSNSGKHKGVGHGKKNGAKKGKKCGRPTTSTQTTTTVGSDSHPSNDPPGHAAGKPDRPKDTDQGEQEETPQTHKPPSGSGSKADHRHDPNGG